MDGTRITIVQSTSQLEGPQKDKFRSIQTFRQTMSRVSRALFQCLMSTSWKLPLQSYVFGFPVIPQWTWAKRKEYDHLLVLYVRLRHSTDVRLERPIAVWYCTPNPFVNPTAHFLDVKKLSGTSNCLLIGFYAWNICHEGYICFFKKGILCPFLWSPN